MRLFFDTETSGLWKEDLPPLDQTQPYLCQLGARLYDAEWKLAGRLVCLIRPNGWEIEPGAFAVHGITTLRCKRFGIDPVAALVVFRGFVDCAEVIAAHNMNFDLHIMMAAIHRAGSSSLWLTRRRRSMICTMESATEECRIPWKHGGFKHPSLDEGFRHFYPEAEERKVHDADSDLERTVAVYRGLLDRGRITEPDPLAELGI